MVSPGAQPSSPDDVGLGMADCVAMGSTSLSSGSAEKTPSNSSANVEKDTAGGTGGGAGNTLGSQLKRGMKQGCEQTGLQTLEAPRDGHA